MRLGTTEIILIIILALVLFGGGKLAGVGKALGKSIKDFKNEVKEDGDGQGQGQGQEQGQNQGQGQGTKATSESGSGT